MLFALYLTFTVPCLMALADTVSLRSLDEAPVLHFTLSRRGGPFGSTEPTTDHANLTTLARRLENTESRFNLTKREVKGNRLVRKARVNTANGRNRGVLMGEVAADGIWFVPGMSSALGETDRLALQVRPCQDWRPTTGG